MKLEELYTRDGLYYNKYTDNLFSGYIGFGNKKGLIKDGLRQGIWTEHENMKLIGTMEWKDGKKHGVSEFYDNGKLSNHSVYENGEIKVSEIYNENVELEEQTFWEGNERKTINYFKNGKIIKTEELF